jgi:hypothetical protein
MRIPAALALVLIFGAPAFAAETYTFVLQSQGEALETFRKGRVLVDGNRYRVELDEPGDPEFPYDVLLSTDGGRSETGLFIERRTYYRLEEPRLGFRSPLFALVPTSDEPKLKNVQIAVVEAPETEVVSGLQTRRYEVRLSYDISTKLYSETVRGKVTLEAVYWLAEGPERTLPTLLRPVVTTGIAELDDRLREPLSKLRGFPVRQRVTVTAEGKEVPRRTSTLEVSLSVPANADAPAGAFEVPKGFRFEEPEFSRPGGPHVG